MSTHTPVDTRRLPWIRRLFTDYTHEFSLLAEFFSGNPKVRSDWQAAISRRQAYPSLTNQMVDILTAQQRQRHAPPEALLATDQLRDPRTVAVVTGHQAGLFGGPLFTLLKALTAIRLAEKISIEHKTPTVAVFWIDAEDHDWNEVRSCSVLNSELVRQEISLPSLENDDPTPASGLRLDASIEKALANLNSILNPTEFTESLFNQLREIYRPKTRFVDAFGRWMETIFGARGLIVFDSSDPTAKPLASRIFHHELSNPGQTSRLAAECGTQLITKGYHAQVTPQPNSVALFHLDGIRCPIRLTGKAFTILNRSLTAHELLEEVNSRPARFSPNVLLRPIVQDTLFPTVCYVAGPNELAYLAQLKEIYNHFSVPMPLIYPRQTATIIDSSTNKFLTRHDLSLETLQPQDESTLNRLLESQIPLSVEQSLNKATQTIQERMNIVASKIAEVDPTLVRTAQSVQTKMERELQNLHTKIIQAKKRQNETLRRQYLKARAQTFPDGKPQERALGFLHFLNNYGPSLIDRIHKDLTLEIGEHWVITI